HPAMSTTPPPVDRRAMLRRGAAAALLAWPALHARAAEPPRTMRWLLGFPPGGGTDTLLRVLAPQVGRRLGATIVIENKPGANGNLASDAVAKAAPDGGTWLYNTSSVVTGPWLYKNLAFDPFRDFAPVALVANIPLLLVAHPGLAANTLAEFVALAKAQPGRLTYASAGNGNVTHLANLLFQQAAGISAVHVPYRGGGLALNDTVAGHVQFYMDTANTALGFVKEGRLHALAGTGTTRLAALPEVPTVAETVAPGFEAGSWSGLLAPARTPPTLIRQVAAAVLDALREPELEARFAAQSALIRGLGPQDYASFLRAEYDRWGRIIRGNGISLE
ncbi:MAG TPA: tripartite tricarboxylate transporter substrate binding protein, partial [Ramlibacter sp.]|nr:tripartite tricarboxylate transporter substrate binding protein [Ramlibacter sp.]